MIIINVDTWRYFIMSKKKRLSYQEKLKACRLYEQGNEGQVSIAKKYNISRSGFQAMYFKYKKYGPKALKMKSTNKTYKKELKEQIIEQYNTGRYTYKDLAIKYGILNPSLIARWVLGYNGSNKTAHRGKGGVTMKGRKTTLEERVEVVKYLIETEIDYHKTSKKFKVSYQQVYQWYQKYLVKGVEGLIDRRGIKKQKHELEENEILRRENERLRRALELSQAEIEVLKKNEELEEKAHLAELDIKNSMKP